MLPDIAAGLGGAWVIAVLIGSVLKPLIERAIGTEGPVHDAIIRGIALAMGVIGTVVNYGITTHAPTAAGYWQVLIPGMVLGGAAIANYHLVSTGFPSATVTIGKLTQGTSTTLTPAAYGMTSGISTPDPGTP